MINPHLLLAFFFTFLERKWRVSPGKEKHKGNGDGGGRVPVVYTGAAAMVKLCVLFPKLPRVANSLPFVAWESKCWTTFSKSMSRPESFFPSRFFLPIENPDSHSEGCNKPIHGFL